MSEINWERYACDLLEVLDDIQYHEDATDEIIALARMRFTISERYEVTRNIDWKSYAMGLLDILDLIEINQNAAPWIIRLCKRRFALAEEHGMTVEFGEPISGLIQ